MQTGIAPLLGPALGLSAILFSLGVAGVLLRRNVIVLFVCIELMLNAVNLTFVALAQLAIILAVFRHKQTVDLQNINLLRG